MHTRTPHWTFGPCECFSEELATWWRLHAPVVDEWLSEMEAAGDPWWPSAEHAAFCLVSYQESQAQMEGRSPSWDRFDVADFLFHDLHEGGTVAFFGSVRIFFDHLVEALRRFAGAGLLDADQARAWLAKLESAREDFIRYYEHPTDVDAPFAPGRQT
ncbi:MAG: hypothetical protein ACODAU_13290 [Myxococcota bacterium]